MTLIELLDTVPYVEYGKEKAYNDFYKYFREKPDVPGVKAIKFGGITKTSKYIDASGTLYGGHWRDFPTATVLVVELCGDEDVDYGVES